MGILDNLQQINPIEECPNIIINNLRMIFKVGSWKR